MWALTYITACLFMAGLSAAQREGYCMASDYEPYLRFSTKTAYELVKGRENNQHIVPNCRPIHFWSINRHGTKLPGLQQMEELPKLMSVRDDVVANYEIKRTAPDYGRLCNQDLENLKQWIWNRNYTKNFANDLTYQGYDDIKFLAKRWQSKFPSLLPAVFSPRKYEFRYTEKRRTKDSYRAFIDGLFGRDNSQNIPSPTGTSEINLEAYESNNSWISNVKNNPTTTAQLEQFKKKEEYKNMVANVSSHLGYRYPLDEKVIQNIYDMCRFDKSWEINKNSPWCAAFNKEQLQLLEYAEDLRYYYEYGYGSELNKNVGCVPVADFMKKFKKHINNTTGPEYDQPSATVYFTHSATIQTMLTAMGIEEDSVPLTSDNYHTQNIQRRKWRTSLLDPFASNLAAILYQCDQADRYQVMFFLNEKPVEFDECRVGLCSWDVVRSKFNHITENCNPNFGVANSVGTNKPSNYLLISIISVISLFAISRL